MIVFLYLVMFVVTSTSIIFITEKINCVDHFTPTGYVVVIWIIGIFWPITIPLTLLYLIVKGLYYIFKN